MDRDMMECWTSLANAVILQAIDDYRAVCGKLKRRPDLQKSAAQKRSLERFFTSRWFRTLTTVDGQALLDRLREEG